MPNATLSLRIDSANPDHHLWNNNGTWFIHYTEHPDRLTARRIRRSLRTRSPEEARTRRDAILRGRASRANSEDATRRRRQLS